MVIEQCIGRGKEKEVVTIRKRLPFYLGAISFLFLFISLSLYMNYMKLNSWDFKSGKCQKNKGAGTKFAEKGAINYKYDNLLYTNKKREAKALAEKFKGKSFYSKVCHFRYEEGFNSAIGCIKNTHYHIRQGGGDALLWTCTKILTKLQWTEGIQPPSPPHIGMLPLGLMLIYK